MLEPNGTLSYVALACSDRAVEARQGQCCHAVRHYVTWFVWLILQNGSECFSSYLALVSKVRCMGSDAVLIAQAVMVALEQAHAMLSQDKQRMPCSGQPVEYM